MDDLVLYDSPETASLEQLEKIGILQRDSENESLDLLCDCVLKLRGEEVLSIERKEKKSDLWTLQFHDEEIPFSFYDQLEFEVFRRWSYFRHI